MGKALVALDTDHIKGYVFGTDRLKEIRGASSLLDYLNRYEMKKIGKTDSFQAICIYANGGSGLFVLDEEKVGAFAKQVQLAYSEQSGGMSSITYAIQSIPVPNDISKDKLMNYPLKNELLLLQYRLEEAKNNPPSEITLSSHPFMRPCDACGIEYAQHQGTKRGLSDDIKFDPKDQDSQENIDIEDDEEEEDQTWLYCDSCYNKHQQDKNVRETIKKAVWSVRRKENVKFRDGYLWDQVIDLLQKKGYQFPSGRLPRRPKDFNVFRELGDTTNYLGLIYADGNGMGKALMEQDTLRKRQDFADNLDGAVFKAMAAAIHKHLPIIQPQNIFPFDILLIGGDDIVVVTPAANAPDVALTIAREFEDLTKEKDPKGKGYTLSVGVVLAPVKYPFGLLQDLAEDALRFAKKHSEAGESRINFVTVTGSTSQKFDKVYQSLSRTRTKDNLDRAPEFYATMRPYTIDQFNQLLEAIRRGHELGLGRTKLHQLREAILKRNLTTSVNDALATVRNWRKDQREYIVKHVYTLAKQYQEESRNLDDPSTWFPRVTFPWFANGKDEYRTTLLDFIELYDFVAGEEAEDSANEA